MSGNTANESKTNAHSSHSNSKYVVKTYKIVMQLLYSSYAYANLETKFKFGNNYSWEISIGIANLFRNFGNSQKHVDCNGLGACTL